MKLERTPKVQYLSRLLGLAGPAQSELVTVVVLCLLFVAAVAVVRLVPFVVGLVELATVVVLCLPFVAAAVAELVLPVVVGLVVAAGPELLATAAGAARTEAAAEKQLDPQ